MTVGNLRRRRHCGVSQYDLQQPARRGRNLRQPPAYALRRRASTPADPAKTDIVELDVSNYSGKGSKRRALTRWLCMVDTAVQARQQSSEFARTHFLLCKLTEKAKECALGKLAADSSCFPKKVSLKEDLRFAFEPL